MIPPCVSTLLLQPMIRCQLPWCCRLGVRTPGFFPLVAAPVLLLAYRSRTTPIVYVSREPFPLPTCSVMPLCSIGAIAVRTEVVGHGVGVSYIQYVLANNPKTSTSQESQSYFKTNDVVFFVP